MINTNTIPHVITETEFDNFGSLFCDVNII